MENLNYVNYEYFEKAKSKEAAKKVRKELGATHFCVLCALILSLTVSFVLSLVLSILSPRMLMTEGIPGYLYYIINMFGSAFTIGMPFFVYLAFRKEGVSHHLRFKKVKCLDASLLVLGAVALCLLANFPSMLIMELVESVGLNGGAQEDVSGTNLFESILYFLTIAVFPPIFEEFAFRGVMLGALRKHGDIFALTVSSVAFALMHVSVSSMPFALICGFCMGYVYLRTENLWLSILIHFINNANATVPGILYLYLDENIVNLISNIIFYGLILVGVIAIVILFVKNKVFFKAEGEKRSEAYSFSGLKKLGLYFTSPVTLLTVLITTGMIVLSVLGIY